MDLYEVMESLSDKDKIKLLFILANKLGMDIGCTDNQGQILIYTGHMRDSQRNIVPFVLEDNED